MTQTGYIVLGLALFLATASVLWSRHRLVHTMSQLDTMLNQAIDGTFTQERFDESRLSALENKLGRYLAASNTSARNLQKQKDQISTLIADISHQTRTPVANLQLYAQLLKEQPLSCKGQECARAISSQAEKLQNLIEALIKSSRLETGILALHPQKESIATAVTHAVAQYAPKAEEKQLTLTMGDVDGTAVFDLKWTEEALCNLLDNAVKYTPAGGSIAVTVVHYTLFSAIRVSDTGPGIPEEEQARIFSRFYRSPAVYGQQGVGIGLYLSRQIATEQGGYVKVESRPEGGSVFSLYLPRGDNTPYESAGGLNPEQEDI